MMLRTMSNRGGNIWLPRYASMAQGATIPQLFTAAGAGVPGLCYRFADSRFNSAARNGSTGFGATSGPLGLVLDQRFGALDALGVDVLGGIGGFTSSSGWGTPIAGASISGGALAFDGATSITNGATILVPSPSLPATIGATYELSYDITGDLQNAVSINFGGVTTTARVGPGSYTEVVTATSTASVVVQARITPGPRTGGIDNISVREIPGTHNHALSDGARPNIEAFPGSAALGARFDGIDDALQSVRALDMSSTDEVTVIAVVRALGATGIIAEFGPASFSTIRTFGLVLTAATGYRLRSYGLNAYTDADTTGATFPDSAILVGRAKLGAPVSAIRRNSGAEIVNVSAQGAANYSSQFLNIGVRNAESPAAFYSGHIAALCVVGLQPSSLPAEWVETMTGLLLPPGATFS
jgi:hypothetical protein